MKQILKILKIKNLITYDKFENTEYHNFWGTRNYGEIHPLEPDYININDKTLKLDQN